MRIVIDRSTCIGAGDCVENAPYTFALDDENLAYMLDPPHDTMENIAEAIRLCPVDAIRLGP